MAITSIWDWRQRSGPARGETPIHDDINRRFAEQQAAQQAAARVAAGYPVTDATGRPRPSFTPASGFTGTDRETRTLASRTMTQPLRIDPAAVLAPPPPAAPAEPLPVFDAVEGDRFRAEQEQAARELAPQHDATARLRTSPQPVVYVEPPVQPEPAAEAEPQPAAPAEPEAPAAGPESWVRGWLRADLWRAVHDRQDDGSPKCPDCEAESGPCWLHHLAWRKEAAYQELYDAVTLPRPDAEALRVVAVVLRDPGSVAELSDIAPEGSPLEAVLLGAIAQLDAEAGAR